MTLREKYEPVNTIFPETLPPITRIEAQRAAGKIMRHFTGKRQKLSVRRCWTALSAPYNDLARGWRRLVHDLSHRIMYRRGHSKPHSGIHAKLEAEIVQYVIEKRWLDGVLKPSVAPRHALTNDDRLVHVETLLARWTTKKRRAETAIKKLQKRARYYTRKMQHE